MCFNDIKILAERACRDMMICDLLRPVVLLFAEVCCFVICWDLLFRYLLGFVLLHLADMAKKELHGFTTMQLKT